MSVCRIVAAVGLKIALFASASALAAEDAANFYKGKQIRLIVSTDAGGAYDTYARLMAQVLKDHIPGHPGIVIQNMPGASGLKTANYIYASAPRDGSPRPAPPPLKPPSCRGSAASPPIRSSAMSGTPSRSGASTTRARRK